MEAIWGSDYDYTSDKIYTLPVCPKCEVEIVKQDDGNYRCLNCGEIVEVNDEAMKEWLKLREEVKVEYKNCISCGGKKCVEVMSMRNPVTLRWQNSTAKCKKCGVRIIV